MITIRLGDCRDVLASLPEQHFHTCVTSPPYFGLRDYGVDGQIGLEPTPDQFVSELVAVFREVRRVLRDDGTVWLNLGDSYAASGMGGNPAESAHRKQATNTGSLIPGRKAPDGLKPKDLIGIPWRVAFALQADGWVLRQEIIWAKPNPMPESVTDRCTKSHEQIFLFSKAQWSGPDNGRFAHISDEDARWLALCIDTEGCIVVKRCKHEGRGDTFAPQVSFGSTSAALMERFSQIVGYGNLARRPGKNCDMIYWQVANNIARDFLHRIYPFLIVKQRQARIGVHVDSLTYFRGGKRPERKRRSEAETQHLLSLWERNKALNNFGDPDLSDVPEPVYGRWSKSARYHFDAAAISEPSGWDPANTKMPDGWDTGPGGHGAYHREGREKGKVKRSGNKERKPASDRGVPVDTNGKSAGAVAGSVPWEGSTRNRRSVWTIATQPFSEAHFATFPPALIEPCILAGAPAHCCAKCGAPFERRTERVDTGWNGSKYGENAVAASGGAISGGTAKSTLGSSNGRGTGKTETIGFEPSCDCGAGSSPGRVLDPFGGAGTTGLVADRLQRNATLIELNPEYVGIMRRRLQSDAGLFAEIQEGGDHDTAD